MTTKKLGTEFEVQKHACATCIYHKDSPLDLKALEAQIADPNMEGFFCGYRQCHHSTTACCRGFWNQHKDDFMVGQLAQRLGLVVFVEHDELHDVASGYGILMPPGLG